MAISTCIATTSTQLSAVAEIRHPDTQTNKITNEQTTVCAGGSAHRGIKIVYWAINNHHIYFSFLYTSGSELHRSTSRLCIMPPHLLFFSR